MLCYASIVILSGFGACLLDQQLEIDSLDGSGPVQQVLLISTDGAPC